MKFPLGMRIAVIADTHGRLPEKIILDLRKADEIWHLGDFCDAAMLDAVRGIGPPVEAILGNNDYGLDLPLTLSLDRCGKRFFLVHIPPHREQEADFLLHGHTHVPRDEMVGCTRFLNPGTIGKPNKGAPPSYAWLTVVAGAAITWEIVPV